MLKSTSSPSNTSDFAAVPPADDQKVTEYNFGGLYPRRRTFKPTSVADAVMEYLRLQGIYTATDFERAVQGLSDHDKIWQLLDPDNDALRMRRIAKALCENPWLKYVRHWQRHVADDHIWTLDDFDRQAHFHRSRVANTAPTRLLRPSE